MPVLSETYGPAVAYKYQNVAAILASTTTYSDHTAGDEVRAEDEDFRYIVAATGATDHQIENSAGTPVKFYVQPKDGEYYLASWGVDGTGVTSCRDDFEDAANLAATNNLPLVLTQNDLLIEGNNIFLDIPNRNTLTIRSTVKTVVRLDNPNIFFRDEGDTFSENLAADVAQHDLQVTVADTTLVKRGDFVVFTSTQGKIETGWNYIKYCVRRVNRVLDATTIELDQAMSMKFDTYEGNRYERAVTGVTQANPGVVTVTDLNLSEGDFIRFEQVEGMTELADTVFRVGPVSGSTFDLHDFNNNPLDTSGYSAFTSAQVMEQLPVTVAVHPPATVYLDNIKFLVGVEKHAISSFDLATGIITTSTDHGGVTGQYGYLEGLGGTVEANNIDCRMERLSGTTFRLRDEANANIDTTGWTTYTSGGYFYTSTGVDMDSTVAFDGVSGKITNCTFVAPNAYWRTPGALDTATVSFCDDLVFDFCHFLRGRYCPLIQAGSRNVRVTRSTIDRVRHIEIAAWAEDTLIEDVTGVDTHGIIQSHPCINTIWRRVRDFNTSDTTAAINIRGVGEIVEDCQSEMHDGVVGEGTNNMTVHYLYADWAASFPRRLSGLRSRTIAPSSAHGPFTVERCEVPYISGAGLDATTYVDEQTVCFSALDRSRTSPFNDIVMPGRVNVPKLSAYTSEVMELDITNITKANPPVITSAGHGIQTGQIIRVEDVLGMTEMNKRVQTITVIDADTFSMDYTNSTGYGTYTSGGKVWTYAPTRTITGITQANPAVVTATAHGFSDGDVVWLSGVSGMTSVNTSYFIVAGATANTFELTDLDGDNVDSTGYGAYSSGGKVTRQQLFDTVDMANKPNVGLGSVGLTSTQLYSESAHSSTSIDVPFFLRIHSPGAVSTGDKFHGKMTVKAMTRAGYAEATYDLIIDHGNGASVYNFLEETGSYGIGSDSVAIKGGLFRALAIVQADGETSSANALAPPANERWGVTGVVEVSLSSGADWVASLDVELDVRRV